LKEGVYIIYMNKRIIIIGAVIIILIAVAGYFILNKQKPGFDRQGFGRSRDDSRGFMNRSRVMSPEASQACSGKSEADTCTFTINDNIISGKCNAFNGTLACFPGNFSDRRLMNQ
jgi:hypothetical protein